MLVKDMPKLILYVSYVPMESSTTTASSVPSCLSIRPVSKAGHLQQEGKMGVSLSHSFKLIDHMTCAVILKE